MILKKQIHFFFQFKPVDIVDVSGAVAHHGHLDASLLGAGL